MYIFENWKDFFRELCVEKKKFHLWILSYFHRYLWEINKKPQPKKMKRSVLSTFPASILLSTQKQRQINPRLIPFLSLYLNSPPRSTGTRPEPNRSDPRTFVGKMFGRIRASPSSLDSLEGFPPSKILKDDSFSIYGTLFFFSHFLISGIWIFNSSKKKK